ncbi:MAG: hypothetical protein E6R03_09830 [Hyphomicrobiaceae bacterium]|nr:MAG: hypothetical protein E6R03_09830 [Hyphomicrobiaceae bacterium]
MKTIKDMSLGAIFAIFLLAFLVSSQTKKEKQQTEKAHVLLIEKHEPGRFVLPDSTREKIRMADLEGKRLDSIALVMERKNAADQKQNDALKQQGAQLDALTKWGAIKVDTIPRPKLTGRKR